MTDSRERTIWDIPISSLFPLVLEFYRKERDHISLDYGQKIKFLAFYKQEKLGPYCPEKDLDTGYFDVVGSDRRKAWKSLGGMSQGEARHGLISLLDAATPRLREFVLEQWKSKRAAEQREKGSKRAAEQRENGKMEVAVDSPDHDHPKDHQDGLEASSVPNDHQAPTPTTTSAPADKPPIGVKSVLAPAALWCSPKAARQFICQVKDSTDSQLVINSGETVVIQVPTTTDASAVFWEFVTESSDIGFGLGFQRRSDQECPVEVLLPVVRRDCSEDLVLGSHQYQSQGTYFLRFDNSYSLQSPKVVYYKVFYQKTT